MDKLPVTKVRSAKLFYKRKLISIVYEKFLKIKKRCVRSSNQDVTTFELFEKAWNSGIKNFVSFGHWSAGADFTKFTKPSTQSHRKQLKQVSIDAYNQNGGFDAHCY